MLWVARERMIQLRGPFTENGSIATLKRNTQRIDKKSLYHQWRGPSKLSVANTGGDTTDELPETIAKGASGFQDQGNYGGSLHLGQLGILVTLLIFALPSRPKRTRWAIRAKGRGHRRMGDGKIEEKGDPIQGEAKVWTLTIFSASLRDRLQSRPAKERNKELQEDGVTRGDGSAPEILADHEMIWEELISTGAVAGGGGRRG
jgi:hypothetical protein